MTKRILGFTLGLLLLFSQGVFAENWMKLRSNKDFIEYLDISSMYSYKDGTYDIVVLKTKMIHNIGWSAIGVSEYKIFPVVKNSDGHYTPPVPLEARINIITVRDDRGEVIKTTQDNLWTTYTDKEPPLALFAWYLHYTLLKEAKE